MLRVTGRLVLGRAEHAPDAGGLLRELGLHARRHDLRRVQPRRRTKRPAAAFSPIARSSPASSTLNWPAAGCASHLDVRARDEALVVEPVQQLAVVLGEPDDRRAAPGVEVGERRQLPVLGLLERGVDGQPCGQRVGMAELLLDPLDHVVGERVAELVGVDVRLAGRVAHEVGEQPLDDPVLADDPLGALAVPVSVRIASLCSPRSTSPSASSRFSISPAEARETPSISATRDGERGASLRIGRYSPIGNARK